MELFTGRWERTLSIKAVSTVGGCSVVTSDVIGGKTDGCMAATSIQTDIETPHLRSWPKEIG